MHNIYYFICLITSTPLLKLPKAKQACHHCSFRQQAPPRAYNSEQNNSPCPYRHEHFVSSLSYTENGGFVVSDATNAQVNFLKCFASIRSLTYGANLSIFLNLQSCRAVFIKILYPVQRKNINKTKTVRINIYLCFQIYIIMENYLFAILKNSTTFAVINLSRLFAIFGINNWKYYE